MIVPIDRLMRLVAHRTRTPPDVLIPLQSSSGRRRGKKPERRFGAFSPLALRWAAMYHCFNQLAENCRSYSHVGRLFLVNHTTVRLAVLGAREKLTTDDVDFKVALKIVEQAWADLEELAAREAKAIAEKARTIPDRKAA